MKNIPWKVRGQGQMNHFRILHPVLFLRNGQR